MVRATVIAPSSESWIRFQPGRQWLSRCRYPHRTSGSRRSRIQLRVGSGGNAMSSQETPGQSRESITTQGKWYGDGKTAPQQRMDEQPRCDLSKRRWLSQPVRALAQPIPSNSHNYGFQGGARGWGGTWFINGIRRGWILPPTSTTAVDLGIVDPR